MWVSAKKVINCLIGDTILAPNILHDMIAPADSDPAKTKFIHVKMIATVIKLERVPLIAPVKFVFESIVKILRI